MAELTQKYPDNVFNPDLTQHRDVTRRKCVCVAGEHSHILATLPPHFHRRLSTTNNMGKVNRRKAADYEIRLPKAIKATERLQHPLKVSEAAEEYQVDKRTLYRRIAGTHKSRSVSHQDQQRLTPAEERAIVKWCHDQDDRGFPPRLEMVKDMARHLECVMGAFRPDGLVFTRPCKIFQAKVFKEKKT